MKATALLAALALSLATTGAIAEDKHEAKALHGGLVMEANHLDYELVAKADTIALYVRDHGKPVDLKGASGKLTLLAGTAKTEAALAPAGDKLEAKGAFPAAAGTKVVATVQLAGKKAANLRFTLK
jgi:hypothetical protein